MIGQIGHHLVWSPDNLYTKSNFVNDQYMYSDYLNMFRSFTLKNCGVSSVSHWLIIHSVCQGDTLCVFRVITLGGLTTLMHILRKLYAFRLWRTCFINFPILWMLGERREVYVSRFNNSREINLFTRLVIFYAFVILIIKTIICFWQQINHIGHTMAAGTFFISKFCSTFWQSFWK